MKNIKPGITAIVATLILFSAGCATGPKNEAPPGAAAPSYVIEGVHFATASAQLNSSAQATLNEAANGLRANSGVPYEVAGHTDSVGAANYNQGLSERRANSVRSYLVQQGVDTGQLTARGYGETSPVASNDTAEGRSQNRRVEINPN